MHRCLTPDRYSNLTIREHLVTQYLLGTLSLKTRKRLESLIANDTTWYELIAKWHSHLSVLEPVTSDKPPPWVWKNITLVLDKQRETYFWKRWRSKKWSLLFPIGAMLLLLFSSLLLFITEPQIPTSSYIAVMSSTGQNNSLVLIAYKANSTKKPSIQLECNAERHSPDTDMKTAMLWVKDKNNGQVTLLGHFTDFQTSKLLIPTEWDTIKNSSEVFITINNNPQSKILFKGICLELPVAPS